MLLLKLYINNKTIHHPCHERTNGIILRFAICHCQPTDQPHHNHNQRKTSTTGLWTVLRTGCQPGCDPHAAKNSLLTLGQ